MPRPSSAQSEADEGSDMLLSEEYERLQNQLRTLQNERQKQTEETDVKMGKYNKEIAVLQRENEEIKSLLALASSEQNKKKDLKAIEVLKHHLAQQDAIQEQVEDIKRYNQRLDAEVKKYEKLIRSKQQERCAQVKFEKEAGDLKSELEKKIETMETNLHTKMSKFCGTLAYNEGTRDSIEKLRNERKIFVRLHRRLSEKLEDINKVKAKLTHQATVAYDQRDEAKNKRLALEEKNEKDKGAYEAELRDLQRTIDHNEQLHKFMATKADERTEWKQKAEERRQKYGSTGEIARAQQKKKIEQYEEAMDKLQQITEKHDVHGIIRVYQRKEDENFTNFNYVTELNNHIEDVREDIERIQLSMKECLKDNAHLEETKHKQMHSLEVKMNMDKKASDADKLRVAQIHKVLDEIKSQIKMLAVKLGCDISKIVEMLGGDGEEVTERNLMLYLNALEQRVDELLSIKCYASSKGLLDSERNDDSKTGMTLGLVEPTKLQTDLSLSLPSLNDEEDDTSEQPHGSVRPLTQAELMTRVTKEIQRQEVGFDQATTRSSNRTLAETKKIKK
ncbi:unnamed protein product [Calicophoron daubneyi]|uniref:ODAD1 central coiled coil region domain-containing protein n=1 Tax=Calicophoron daubneyi TaxID=300641 RepID=A0AAV2TYN5_CALDB